MRLTFPLDENIIYHAINGVDEFDNPSTTAAELIEAIARICHGICGHAWMVGRYRRIIKVFEKTPPPTDIMVRFLAQLIIRSDKLRLDFQPAPELPSGIVIPREDIDIVRAALASEDRPVVVANDKGLRDAINSQPVLGLAALDASEALERARSERPDTP